MIETVAVPVRPVAQSVKSKKATHVGRSALAAVVSPPAVGGENGSRPGIGNAVVPFMSETPPREMPVSSRNRRIVSSFSGRSSTTAYRGAAPAGNATARTKRRTAFAAASPWA